MLRKDHLYTLIIGTETQGRKDLYLPPEPDMIIKLLCRNDKIPSNDFL